MTVACTIAITGQQSAYLPIAGVPFGDICLRLHISWVGCTIGLPNVTWHRGCTRLRAILSDFDIGVYMATECSLDVGRFRKKPVIVSAWRWHIVGDKCGDIRVVDVRDRPAVHFSRCYLCSRVLKGHGYIGGGADEDGRLLCPGNWIVRDCMGEISIMKSDVFEMTYESIFG